MAPNILLVVLDAVRRDAIDPYGASRITPTIGQLARAGNALPSAYTTSSWTLPSHASMFTGMLPHQLGLGQAPGGSPQGARPALERVADRLLPEVLRRAGYSTHGFSTNLWVSRHSGFDIGFDTFTYSGDQRHVARGRLFRERPDARLGWAVDGLRARSDDGADEIRQRLTQSIAHGNGSPAFWFVNLCECHSPYLPPQPWNDLPPRERVRAALEAQRYLNFQAICLYVAGHARIPDEALQRMRHLYGRAAAYMDQWLAAVLEALDSRGILDNTLVIVTSDHGENFGEGGLIAHGFSLDERLIHVPLVIAGPGAADIEQPFSLADLPALIARYAGIDEHPWRRSEMPAGLAIAQYDPLGRPTDPRVSEFAARWSLDTEAIGRLTTGYRCATDGLWKLVLSDRDELFYDLQSDPDENSPLDPASAPAAFATLRDGLERSETKPLENASAAVTGPATSEAEVEAIERQMKLLGYM